MNRLFSLFLLLQTSITFAGSAQIKVIYGEDNRVDVVDSENPFFQRLANSTAAMVKNENLIEHNSVQYELAGKTLQDRGICESERFSHQSTVASCSGFLVAPDVIVTAGHCVQREVDCQTKSWVFNYRVQRESDPSVIVDKSDVYACSKILSQKLDPSSEVDYAVIKLKRSVEGADPLPYRRKGSPQIGDGLVVIGHPSGLPTKIADGANIRDINKVYLTTNLDTYAGNSGSAVLNASTGIVEGILVRGETDYINDSAQGCKVSNVLDNDKGDGEEVTLITIVKGIPRSVTPVEPELPETPKPDVPEVEESERRPSRVSLLERIRRFFRRLFT